MSKKSTSTIIQSETIGEDTITLKWSDKMGFFFTVKIGSKRAVRKDFEPETYWAEDQDKAAKHLTAIVYANEAWAAILNNDNKEKQVKMDNQYDLDNSLEEALKELEGRPYTEVNPGMGGHILVETCDHGHCEVLHFEQVVESRNEMCCGVKDCNHYVAILCEEHTPAPKNPDTNPCIGCEAPQDCCEDEIPKTNAKSREFPMHCGKCKGYHKTADDVKRCYGHVVEFTLRDDLGIPSNIHFKTFDGDNGDLMVDEWHSTIDYASRRGKLLGKGKIRRAGNQHGYWLCYKA